MGKSSRLHVTHVVLSLDCGGLERIVLALVREGLRLEQKVSVVCLERLGALAAGIDALNVPVVCLQKLPGLRLCLVPALIRVFRELRPDVVHTHQSGALFYSGLAARLARVPLVVHTEHGNHFHHGDSSVATRLRKWCLWRLSGSHAASFFCVTKDIAAELATRRLIPRRKLEFIPNGIDTSTFAEPTDREALRRSLGFPVDASVIGTVGRLNEIKQQDVLIRAFASVRKEHSSARLLLVGDGPMRSRLEQLANELDLNGTVHFAGYQSEPERYLHAMDVFALTSRTEGMPLAILEAWGSGLPVVASAVGGIPDLIQHGCNGLLFPGRDEARLASLICELLREPKQAHSLGEAGRRVVMTRYNVQRMAYDYQDRYRRLLGRERME